MQAYERIIGDIYDCAANPELWPETLTRVRDLAGVAYASLIFADFSLASAGSLPFAKIYSSPWDVSWFQKLQGFSDRMPSIEILFRDGIDSPWAQLQHVQEQEFHKTEFYQGWVKPQGLRDCLNTMFVDRKAIRGVWTMATPSDRDPVGTKERRIADMLSPHIRRAISINDLVDKGNLARALYRKVLDALSVAVFIVTTGGRVEYANVKADALLSDGSLLRKANGRLATARADISGNKLDDAIDRALKGDAAVGIAGIGVPLASVTGERAAAYVLPISGNDLRGDIGEGYAVVFIAQRGEQQPMAVEILRTVFDLTPMEAKVAYATSLGDNPETIALALGNKVDTVRSHLKSIYAKTDVTDKTALAAQVAALIPPVNA
jgi:DNA-binding CsgD family transcriptional regulator